MADPGAPPHPSVIVSDWGAPPGTVYVHSEADGRTVLAPADEPGYLAAIRELTTPGGPWFT